MRVIVWLLVHLRLIDAPAFVATRRRHRPTPDTLAADQMVVVRVGRMQKWTCFRCPGGCGETINLSMSPMHEPRWIISLDWLSRPTVVPSIWQTNECGCHFRIQRGRVEWCLDGRPNHHEGEL